MLWGCVRVALLQIYEPGETPAPHEGDHDVAVGIDLGQLLDPADDVVQVLGHRLQGVFIDLDAGQEGDAADVVFI